VLTELVSLFVRLFVSAVVCWGHVTGVACGSVAVLCCVVSWFVKWRKIHRYKPIIF